MPKKTKQRPTHRLVLATSLVVLAWASYFALRPTISQAELDAFRSINDWPDSLRSAFLVITQLGSAWILFALTLLAVWKRYSRLALRIFSEGATAFIITEVLKRLIARPRPAFLIPDMHLREALPAGYGFPSGHSALATVLALALLPLLPKKWRWAALAGIVLVGVSRIYLGVHAPLDVVGGIAVGVGVVGAAQTVRGKLRFVTKITRMKLTD